MNSIDFWGIPSMEFDLYINVNPMFYHKLQTCELIFKSNQFHILRIANMISEISCFIVVDSIRIEIGPEPNSTRKA